MKKIKLGKPDPTGFSIIGIVCSKPDYWLSLHLNKVLKIHLARKKDIPIYQDSIHKLVEYSFFMYKDEWNRKTYLLKNEVSENPIFSKYRNFHYYLLLDGYSNDIKEIDSKIKTIPSVLASISFSFKSIPKIDYFLDDFEMHLLELMKSKSRASIL